MSSIIAYVLCVLIGFAVGFPSGIVLDRILPPKTVINNMYQTVNNDTKVNSEITSIQNADQIQTTSIYIGSNNNTITNYQFNRTTNYNTNYSYNSNTVSITNILTNK